MKVFILVISHSFAVALGMSIYHKFFMENAKEMMYDILLNEIRKTIDEVVNEK